MIAPAGTPAGVTPVQVCPPFEVMERAPEEYLSVQESFARQHPWFAVRRLAAVSHFPALEVPDETARVISEFIG